jgi:5-aminolevulinate synthase
MGDARAIALIGNAARQALRQPPSAAPPSTAASPRRNISGTHNPIVELETELADLHGKQAALAFTSGWISNLAAISTITGLLPNCLILSDALNDNSMIEGVKRSGCEKKVWRHSDVKHLEELLAAEPIDRAKLILFESLYSMNGDFAPIGDIVALGACLRNRGMAGAFVTNRILLADEQALSPVEDR